MKKLDSLTIFFPFLNDEGTVERQISFAYKIGRQVAKDREVIAIHGGASNDNTMGKILEMKQKYPSLIVVDRFDNSEGYAVIRHGFDEASKEWVFYTDGDAQYRIEKSLIPLIRKQQATNADVINGYKKNRKDSFWRVVLGGLYAHLSRLLLQLPVRDVDCDFRLIRRRLLTKIKLESNGASILPELVKKIHLSGAKFSEIAIPHYSRIWGESNYNILDLAKEKVLGDFRLYFRMRKYL